MHLFPLECSKYPPSCQDRKWLLSTYAFDTVLSIFVCSSFLRRFFFICLTTASTLDRSDCTRSCIGSGFPHLSFSLFYQWAALLGKICIHTYNAPIRHHPYIEKDACIWSVLNLFQVMSLQYATTKFSLSVLLHFAKVSMIVTWISMYFSSSMILNKQTLCIAEVHLRN